jgi:phosphoglycerol transferase MdoB-like AlkP superfamily enzyme
VKNQFYYIITLLKRLAIILAVFFILRILFYLFNYSRFGSLEFIEAIRIIWGGLRFDASAILYFNLLFILLMLIPFSFRNKSWYGIVSKVVFYVFNIVAICIALADIEYYQFNNKRITFEILAIVDEGQGMFFQFIKDFAYLYIMLAIIIVFIEFLYRKTSTKKPEFKPRHGIQVAIFIIALPIFFVMLRGGE